jgi:hypothetical protein
MGSSPPRRTLLLLLLLLLLIDGPALQLFRWSILIPLLLLLLWLLLLLSFWSTAFVRLRGWTDNRRLWLLRFLHRFHWIRYGTVPGGGSICRIVVVVLARVRVVVLAPSFGEGGLLLANHGCFILLLLLLLLLLLNTLASTSRCRIILLIPTLLWTALAGPLLPLPLLWLLRLLVLLILLQLLLVLSVPAVRGSGGAVPSPR